MGKLTVFVGFLVLFLLLSLLLIKVGWYLFAVPVLGVPDITWLQALGFALLASAFKSTSSGSKN